MPMTPEQVKAALQAEKAGALGGWATSSDLSKQQARALDYYLGDMTAHLPAEPDRSSAVSTDVQDVIEGMMPALMDVLGTGEDLVSFRPEGPEDIDQAEQETDAIRHVVYRLNDGWTVVHDGVKDALLSKRGVLKAWWEVGTEIERERYEGLPQEGLVALSTDRAVDIQSIADRPDGTFDVVLRTKREKGRVRIAAVPPEEFGISRRARCVKDAPYCYHERELTPSDLIAMGFDRELVESIPTADKPDDEVALARETVQDRTGYGSGGEQNPAMRPVRVTEHYIRLDEDGDGIAELRKIVTAGPSFVILQDEEIDRVPFAMGSPIRMPHQAIGRSVADLVLEIQEIKTALLRQMLDNAYQANNQRMYIAEQLAGETTLDDVLTNRVGSVIRGRDPGAVTPIPNQSLGGEFMQLLGYQDSVREARTGVRQAGETLDPNSLSSVTATAANQYANAAAARTKLVARILAQTMVKDLFLIVHELLCKHATAALSFWRGKEWVQADPRRWKKRGDMEVMIGLGPASKEQMNVFLMGLLNIQKEIVAQEGFDGPMVTRKNLHNLLAQMTKNAGLPGVDPYFSDPDEPDPETGEPKQPPAPPPDPKLVEVQAKAQMEGQKLQMQGQMETAKARQSAEIELRRIQMEHALKREQMAAEMALKREQLQAELALQRELETARLAMQERIGAMNADARVRVGTSGVQPGGEPG